MKKVKFFSYALAALMLGACSSEEIVESGAGPQWNSEGKGYINLSIQLPTQPSTRAIANDQFADGTADEYHVYDATLILFTGDATATDDQLKINSAYDMKLNFSPTSTADDNITTTAKIVQEINSISDNKIKALVVLNKNGMFTVENNNLKVGKSGNVSMIGRTLNDLNYYVNEEIGDKNWHADGQGFLMSNAVLSTTQGGSQAPTNEVTETLITIDKTKIYSTEAEANANPAANIYVERAVAKVTLSDKTNKQLTSNAEVKYEIQGWTLDNTNKSSKLVRTANGFNDWKAYKTENQTVQNPYRFVGSTPVETGTSYYRVYWGEDFNYSEDYNAANFATIGGQVPANLTAADGTTPEYCFENTMNLDHMLEQEATRVIVKATFNGGKPFYVVDGDKTTIWDAKDKLTDLKAEIAARVLANPTINDWAKKHVNADKTLTSDYLEVTLNANVAGTITVNTVTLSESAVTDEIVSQEGANNFPTDDALTAANSSIDIEYYDNGASYYSVWIKHFGDDLTPWDNGEYGATAPTAGNIYPDNGSTTNDANYLGRYGVLRNNWYEIEVTGIKYLGSPTVEEVTGETIDKKDSYISVNINVLSWAKRTQSVIL